MFWKEKSLSELNKEEWESLCDGCGKCCLHKLQDEETEELLFTSISCEHLDTNSCRCRVYPQRNDYVADCLNLDAEKVKKVFEWLPSTCAYRLLQQDNDLPVWHPLVCGNVQELHLQHISVKDKVISEALVNEEDWQDYVI